MSFNNRTQFIKSQSSEKLTLAHIDARTRLYEWTVYSGNIYQKTVPYVVVELKQDTVYLTQVSSLGAVSVGEFYYDFLTGVLYAHFNSNANPENFDAIVTYRLFYASGPATLSWDLTNTASQVRYDGRILSSPGFSHKIGVDQGLTSLVGSGTLNLENGDGQLDQLFDTLIFENRPVTIYSWNRDLPFDESKVIYRGRITNKTFSEDNVSFTVKDTLFELEQAIPLEVYTEADNVNTNVIGNYKRTIYGRVDGLKLQSIDQIGTGYNLTGTVSGLVETNTITGTGTLFLSECSPGDELTIGTQEFTIESIASNTSLIVGEEIEFSFAGETAVIVPEVPVTTKNREFLVTSHGCAELTTTVVNVIQLNRIEVASTDGLKAGDFIEFDTLERKEIKNIAPNNIIVLRDNIIQIPNIGSNVIRKPIQKLYKDSKLIEASSFTINNSNTGCTITIPSTLEFDLARPKVMPFDLSFTNGSRTVTTPDSVDLREFLNTRDWIKPNNLTYTTYYEILSVDETSIELRTAFTNATISTSSIAKKPDYIGDDSILSAEVLGKTEDGEIDGIWIKTAPQAVKDILTSIGVSTSVINTASFTTAQDDLKQVISLKLPVDINGKSVKAKEAIDLINESVYGSLTLDNDLKLKYKAIQIDVPNEPVIIRDSDVINWSIKTTNGKSFRDSVVRYRHKDIDRFTLEEGQSIASYQSDFINKYVETSKLSEFDAYLFNDNEAQIMAERYVYFNRLSRSDLDITTDLRLENVEIGDVVQLEFRRLFKRFGDPSTPKKLMVCIGKTVTGSDIKLNLTDYGNLFNSSAVIAPNATPQYSSATTEEKLKYGFITDVQGIVDDNEDTANINLIS